MLKLTKPTWRINNAVELCSFNLQHARLGMIKANVCKVSGKDYAYRSELLNSTDSLLGYDEFSLVSKNVGIMSDLRMAADASLRKKGFGIGELLRLVSIMQLLKNHMNNIDLYSLPEAIYFHSKYKFVPNITRFSERNSLLETIAEDKASDFENFHEQANMALDRIKLFKTSEKQRSFCKSANILGQKYIEEVFCKGRDEYENHSFKCGMDMTLTKSDIIKNKAFFDNKFKSNGIDFEI